MLVLPVLPVWILDMGYFQTAITEELNFLNLSNTCKNDRNVTKLHFYPQHCLTLRFHKFYLQAQLLHGYQICFQNYRTVKEIFFRWWQ